MRRSPDLTGALPTEIYLLTNLEILLVQANVGLSEGTLSSEIGKLSKLQRFATHDIPFKGTIPSEIGLLSDLYLLNMWNCQLFSTVPDELWQLTNLQMVRLPSSS